MISLCDIVSYIHSTIAILGMIFNGLIIYLALFQTPKTIRSYATLIANFGITDFSLCFSDLFVQQRMIPAGRTLAYISYGFCKYFSSTTCYVGNSIMLHFISHSSWSLLLSFSYRFYVLSHPAPKRPTIVLIVSLVYLPSLFQCITFLWAQDEPSEIVEILHSRFPNYDLDGHIVTGTEDIICFTALFTIFHMTLPITPVYISILIMRRKIINQLSFHGSNLAKNTRELHAQLLMALTCQALLPIFYAFSVSSYAIGQLGIYNHPALEYFTFFSTLFVPFFSPLVNFICVTAYRHFVIRTFYKLRKVEPMGFPSSQVNTTSTDMRTVA